LASPLSGTRQSDPSASGSTTAAGRQRRARQRRERIPVDSEIRECGWAVVKINTWPEVDAARRAT